MATSIDLRGTPLDISNEVTDATIVAITFVDPSGDPVDLSPWTFTAPILTPAGDPFDAGGSPAAFAVAIDQNVITLTLNASTIPSAAYRWALIATGSGAPTTWLAGSLELSPRATPAKRSTGPVTVEFDVGVEVTATINVGGAGGGIVHSVNGQTGMVQLNAVNIPATPHTGLSGATVDAQLGQAETLFDSLATDVTNLNNNLGQVAAVADSAVQPAALAAYAPLASPALTGTPTAPTAVSGTDTHQVATTSFVAAAVAALIGAAPGALDTLAELADAIDDDANFAATVTNALAGKQPLSTELSTIAAANNGAILAAVTAAFTTALETKLAGIADNATANQTDAFLLNRTNHTGAQAINTVTGLQTALDGKQAASAVLDALVTADNAAILAAVTAAFTAELQTKLDGIQEGAQQNVQSDWNADSGDAQILNKPTLGALANQDTITVADITATGTAGPTTFLRGDGAWQAPWVALTQAEYDLLDPPQVGTLYLITGP